MPYANLTVSAATKQAGRALLTQEMKNLVAAYLAARTFAEVMREKVNKIHRAILEDMPVYADRWPDDDDFGARILDPKMVFLTNDVVMLQFFAESNKRLRAAGLKPADMPDEFCPALVAEETQRRAENALIETSGKPFGVTNHKLLCHAPGLETRQKWIDLIVGMTLAAEREGKRFS